MLYKVRLSEAAQKNLVSLCEGTNYTAEKMLRLLFIEALDLDDQVDGQITVEHFCVKLDTIGLADLSEVEAGGIYTE